MCYALSPTCCSPATRRIASALRGGGDALRGFSFAPRRGGWAARRAGSVERHVVFAQRWCASPVCWCRISGRNWQRARRGVARERRGVSGAGASRLLRRRTVAAGRCHAAAAAVRRVEHAELCAGWRAQRFTCAFPREGWAAQRCTQFAPLCAPRGANVHPGSTVVQVAVAEQRLRGARSIVRGSSCQHDATVVRPSRENCARSAARFACSS